MKITVKGEAKEIADLIVALQGHPFFKTKCEISVPDNIDKEKLLDRISNAMNC